MEWDNTSLFRFKIPSTENLSPPKITHPPLTRAIKQEILE
jgi:hypothetical protein